MTRSEKEHSEQSADEGAATRSTVKRRRRIALIEAHKVKTGETLAGLTKSCDLTWQALAQFNWGTSDPDEINERLRDDIGGTRKTEDCDKRVYALQTTSPMNSNLST